VIQGPFVPPTDEGRVIVVCRDPARRSLIERLVSRAQVHASAVEGVLACARTETSAVILNLEDLAGAERDVLAAIGRARPEACLYAVVAPEDEPLARSLLAQGVTDYFIVPGDIGRLPQALARGRTPEAAPAAASPASDAASRLTEAACALAGLALTDPATLLREGGALILRALGDDRGCFFGRNGSGTALALLATSGARGAGDAFDMERAVAERAARAGENLFLDVSGAPTGPILCIPAREAGETFGVLCLSGRTAAAQSGSSAAGQLVASLARLYRATVQRDQFARLAQRDAATGLLRPDAFTTQLARLLALAGTEKADVAVVLLRTPASTGLVATGVLAEIGRALAARLGTGWLGGRTEHNGFAVAWGRRHGPNETADAVRMALLTQASSLADLGLSGGSSLRLRMSLAVFPQDARDAASLVAAAEAGLAVGDS
jgi:hypothetical protein